MHKMMRRPAAMYAVLPLLVVLAVSLLFQVSDCSRPSPEEPRTIPRPVLRDDEPHVQRHHRDNADGTGTTRPAGLEMEGAVAVEKPIRAAADDSGAGPSATTTTTPPARDVVGRQVGSGSTNWGGALTMMRPPVRLRSELPRRVLAGVPPVVEGAADSEAKSSCHSSDVHVSCPPSRN
ncbi:unnamed protein product [Miscanthus lutarioriparius]|uniref:Uncharacterized protein n=1 Tax=Miscanthus lutarioriparius TaxID=422564 RepID=A0A811MLF0_9POAL|nr:unnamed protein product [Miscanthus lutarioriparius]